MTIDWITVSAQIVNFLILVWLLQRFLYRPVIRAMDQREQRIADRLNEARDREQAAEEESRRYQRELDKLEQQREKILAQAREDAEGQNRQLLEEGRDKAAAAREAWQRQVDREKEEFLSNLRRRSAEAVQEMTHKVLTELADTDLEARIADRFIGRLGSLDEESRQAFADSDDGTVNIASAFDLDSTVRGRLTQAVHEHLAKELEVEYSQSDDLLCGIVLDHKGRRLSWNIADYLDELTDRVESAFGREPAAESATPAEKES